MKLFTKSLIVIGYSLLLLGIGFGVGFFSLLSRNGDNFLSVLEEMARSGPEIASAIAEEQILVAGHAALTYVKLEKGHVDEVMDDAVTTMRRYKETLLKRNRDLSEEESKLLRNIDKALSLHESKN
ncbi:hypothetical protein BH23VER1_BH23VER1_08680 [soil metagenome]